MLTVYPLEIKSQGFNPLQVILVTMQSLPSLAVLTNSY